MSITVTFPKSPSKNVHRHLELSWSLVNKAAAMVLEKAALAVPVFSVDNQDFVLIRDLAVLLGLPFIISIDCQVGQMLTLKSRKS